jgi:hypothetical protein
MSREHHHEHHSHEHGHHAHGHHHEHGHCHHSHAQPHRHGNILTIRAHSGLSGDIMLAGLMRMTEISAEDFEARLASLMPELAGSVELVRREVNHIGDIDVYNNEVFCGVELFVDGVASNIQIAVYDGDTLTLKRTFNFEPDSGQDECSGICVNPDEGIVSLCAWTDSGEYLYNYDLDTGEYLGKVRLSPVPTWVQGVAYHKGAYYLSADDGDANDDAPDHVYRFELAGGASEVQIEPFVTLDDVQRQGEIEGLTFDEDSTEMLVLYNRGAVIEQGMPVGFYDGYDREIHEVYVYGGTSGAGTL